MKHVLKKFACRCARFCMVLFCVVAILLLLFQNRIIYFPRSYGNSYPIQLPNRAVELNYETGQGAQRSFYLPPHDPTRKVPSRLWVLFGGNGSLALDWSDFAARYPEPSEGFLLIEYPGYGFCRGSASPDSIQASALTALQTLESQLQLPRNALAPGLGVIGHSIGCGAALNFAAARESNHLILLAPFTSLRDMARRVVGFPLCHLLRGNFDNRARIRELANSHTPPRISIFHGSDDALIPPAMGRELAGLAPKIATFEEIANAEHNDVAYLAERLVYAKMAAGKDAH